MIVENIPCQPYVDAGWQCSANPDHTTLTRLVSMQESMRHVRACGKVNGKRDSVNKNFDPLEKVQEDLYIFNFEVWSVTFTMQKTISELLCVLSLI
jgi:hypothetical protein